MLAFTQYTPTEIVFGPKAENQIAALVKKYGGSKVIVVYGEGSVVKSGLLDLVTKQLDDAGIDYIKHGGATPNPHLSFAKVGIKAAIDFGVDFILAVGGGSAIDAGKAIAHGTKNPETDIWKFWLKEEVVTKSLPVGVVLTISAAGSETSNSAVLTNTDTGEKRGINTDFNRPCFAIMNPEFTFTLPKFQIACGIADIMMHTMDRYFAQEDSNEMTDEIAEGLLRVTIKNGRTALENPKDYNAMSEIMWAGSLSHNGITGLGRTHDFSAHQFGHELSGRFDVAHGASLTTMWASIAEYCCKYSLDRFKRYACEVWGVSSDLPDEEAAQMGIDRTVEYFKSIGMPTCFTELGIGVQSDEVVQALAYDCVFKGTRLIGAFNLDQKAVYEIYKAANR